MTRTEFRYRIRRAGLNCEEYAAMLGVSTKTLYEWGGPRYGVPYHARLLLHLIEERGGAHGLLGRPGCTGARPSMSPSATARPR